MTKKISSIAMYLLTLGVAFTFSGCLKDDDKPSGNPEYSDIEINLSQIPDLGLDYSYYAWLSLGNDLVYLGDLEPDASGNFSATYSFGKGDLSDSDVFYVTIEPFDDRDPGPSGWRVLEIRFSGSEGQVNNAPFIKSGSADLATGQYVLATPTTLASNDEFSGIWFVNGINPPMAGLTLPELEENWTYETWVEIDGLWLSAGQFRNPNGSDNRAAFSSAERPPFPFPGEDFVQALPGNIPAPDLRGKNCYVTIEPVDKVSTPFYLTVLRDQIKDDAPARTVQPMVSTGTGIWILGDAKRK